MTKTDQHPVSTYNRAIIGPPLKRHPDDVLLAQVWMLADPCADPRIFARVVQARLPENSSNNVFVFFCPQLLQFYSGLSMVYFKEIYNFTIPELKIENTTLNLIKNKQNQCKFWYHRRLLLLSQPPSPALRLLLLKKFGSKSLNYWNISENCIWDNMGVEGPR